MIRFNQFDFALAQLDPSKPDSVEPSSADRDAADHELELRVIAFLADRHLPSLRRLRVEARGGTVTLRGQVRTFYEKQVGHHSARRVAGVLHVVDAIDVAAAYPTVSDTRPAMLAVVPSVLDLPQVLLVRGL